jgi:hypothetical protein
MSEKPNRKGHKANYGKATPEQVAKALHRYRPGRSVTPEKVAVDPPRVKSSL